MTNQGPLSAAGPPAEARPADGGVDRAQRKLTRTYFWGAVVIGLATFALSWFLAATLGSGDGLGTFERLFAFFASFGASAIWWAFLARVAEQEIFFLVRQQLDYEQAHADRTRREELELLKLEVARADETRRQETELLRGELARYAGRTDGIPAAVYPGKTGSDLRFNHDLDVDLERTSRYDFQGPTGLYVGVRLKLRQTANRLERVQLRITDPTSKAAVQHAVDDRLNRPDHIGKKRPDVEAELLDDIQMALIALYDNRHRARMIRILLERRAAGVRVELFDSALYDSSVDTPERKNFTHTVRWESSQTAYRERKREIQENVNFSREIVFKPASSEEELRRHLEALAMDPDRTADLRARYDQKVVAKQERVLKLARVFSDELADDDERS